MGWVREGSCPPERCQGRCCRHVGVWFGEAPGLGEYLELVRTRGVRVFDVELPGGEMRHLVDIDQRCQWLTGDNLCALHPEMKPDESLPQRPPLCNDWPTEPAQLIADDCGFTFRWEPEPSEVGST